MTASASSPPGVTLTRPSSTSTFHVPAPSISKRNELVIPAVFEASTRLSSVSKNSCVLVMGRAYRSAAPRSLLLQLDEDGSGRDGGALLDVHGAHDRGIGGGQRRLHLHRFEHDQWLARLHAVALRDENADHRPGHRRDNGALLRTAAVVARRRIDVGRRRRCGPRKVEPEGTSPDAVR